MNYEERNFQDNLHRTLEEKLEKLRFLQDICVGFGLNRKKASEYNTDDWRKRMSLYREVVRLAEAINILEQYYSGELPRNLSELRKECEEGIRAEDESTLRFLPRKDSAKYLMEDIFRIIEEAERKCEGID